MRFSLAGWPASMGAVSCVTNRACYAQLLGLLVKHGTNALLLHIPMCAEGMAVKLILTNCSFKKKVDFSSFMPALQYGC